MRIPAQAPVHPFIYLDWNTVQHLRKVYACGPLLMALLEAQQTGAALLPYSEGHLMDATAGWGPLAPEHRAERLRDLTFLNGLSSEWFWGMRKIQGEQKHFVRPAHCIEACQALGYLVSLYDDTGTDPEGRALGPVAAQGIRAGVTQMREALASAPNIPPDLLDGLLGAMEEFIDAGLPELWTLGTRYTSMLSPVATFASTPFASFDDVGPDQAIQQIDRTIRRLAPDQTFAKLIDMVSPHLQSSQVDATLDDVGPMLIGMLGYCRERARDMRRAAPGIYPDQTHGRHALASAIFISSEARLPRRVEAWAAFTGRGRAHDTWPVILEVRPDEEASILAATEVVAAYTREYPMAGSTGLAASYAAQQGKPRRESKRLRGSRQKRNGG